MSFFDSPIEQTQVSSSFAARRKKSATELLALFRQYFPGIIYDLMWASPTINAQAFRLGPQLHVRLYGGLVRHPAIRRAGLALIIAHEAGHHLGGAPHDPAMPWLTWQGKADFWAAGTAMPRVFGAEARAITLRGARELLALHQAIGPQFAEEEPHLTPRCRLQIFRAAAEGLAIPACAQTEFQREFGIEYRDC